MSNLSDSSMLKVVNMQHYLKISKIWLETILQSAEVEDPDMPDMKDDEDVETPLPNIMELSFYFEQAGIGMNREECYRIWLALKQLVDLYPLQHVR